MAHNMNIIDIGTLAKADPHLTVEDVPAKSYRAEAGWVQDAEVRRSSDNGGLSLDWETWAHWSRVRARLVVAKPAYTDSASE